MRKGKGRPTGTSAGSRRSAPGSPEKGRSFIARLAERSAFARWRSTRLKREQRSRFYRSVDEMPLARFMDVLCDGNYDSMYRESAPKRRNPEYERERFAEFHEEYTSRILDGDASAYESIKRMALHLARIRILEAAMVLVGHANVDAGTRKVLLGIGLRLTGRREKDGMILFSARELTIRKYRHARELYEKERKGDVKQDRGFFMGLLVGMSSHFRYSIPFQLVTVGEFCSYLLQLRTDLRMMKERNDKRQRYGGKH